MSARPLSLTLVAWLFVAVGVVGLASGLWQLANIDLEGHELVDFAFATTSRLLCILGGAFLLRGRGWARWLLVAWMASHLVLSGLHSISDLLVHCALFAPILYVLSRPPASAFLSARGHRNEEDPRAEGTKPLT